MPILNFEKGKIELKNEGEKAKLNFYGDIVSTEWDKWEDVDVAPKDIQDLLYQIGDKDLDIYINSHGGSVFAGMAIANMLKRHKGYITAYVDGLAASIASVIAFVADKIICPSNSYLMIHKAWGRFLGNADDLRKQADNLDVIDEGILNVYKEKLNPGVKIEKIKDMVAKETWLTGTEAKEFFNIELSEPVEIAASFDKSFCDKHKVPEKLRNLLNNQVQQQQQLEDKIFQAQQAELDLARAKLELQLLI